MQRCSQSLCEQKGTLSISFVPTSKMIALSPQVTPITCKHFLDGGLCTCFSAAQRIIRQLQTQITSSIRGALSSLKMLHSVPQQQQESNPGPQTKKMQVFPSGHSCSNVLSISLQQRQHRRSPVPPRGVPVPRDLSCP